MTALATVTAALRRYAGRAYGSLRVQRDRLLHPGRHRRARERMRRVARPRRIVVVCHGNICRSPYLEAALRKQLPAMQVSSAGFVGPGRGVPEFGLTVASRRGLDLSMHRSRLLDANIVRGADIVIVMDERQRRYVERVLRVPARNVVIAGDLDPEIADSRAVRDPWRQSLEVFDESYARLDRCAATLAELLLASSTARR